MADLGVPDDEWSDRRPSDMDGAVGADPILGDDAGTDEGWTDDGPEAAAAAARAMYDGVGGDPDLLLDEEADLLLGADGFGAAVDWDANDPDDWHYNLAKAMPEDRLATLGAKVIEWADADKLSRQDWERREAEGVLLLGCSKRTLGGANFEGAARSVHPGLVRACIEFNARAMAELWPAGGPVKTVVLGDSDEEREQQAERVKGFLNWQYAEEMPGAFDEHDRLLFRLPMSGSAFKKVYFDPLHRTVVSRFVEAEKLLVPYAATSLRDAPRFTHDIAMSRNDLRRLIASGYYLDRIEQAPADEDTDRDLLDMVTDEAEGRRPMSVADDAEAEYDSRDRLYECYAFLDLVADYETLDPLAPEGYGAPYLVTVDRSTQQVLAVRRNWDPDDALYRRRLYFSHYRFLPGLGFYGFGFFHVAAGLSATQTGALRALLDAGQLENSQGGFRSQDLAVKMPEGDIYDPNKWYEVNASAEELQKGHWRPNWPGPSPVLMTLLEYMDGQFSELVSSTEAMIGEDAKNIPVGTILARVEQGLKVFSGIHRRCHEAQTAEFRIVAQLDAEYMPPEYPYQVPGESRAVFASDFDDRVDVVPVSDPNVVSNMQRITQAQAVHEVAERLRDIVDLRLATRRLFEAFRVPDADELVPSDTGEAPRLDPVSEGVRMLQGQAVQAFPEQDHLAHIQAHRAFLATVPEELRAQVEPVYQAHVAEHVALEYRRQVANRIGVPITGEEMPIEAETEVANRVGLMTDPLFLPADLGLTDRAAAPGPGDAETDAKIRRADKEMDAKIRREDVKAAADIQRQAEQEAVKEAARAAGEVVGIEQALGRVPGNRGARPQPMA